jgi:hypothetical protein
MAGKQALGRGELEVQMELENCDLGELQRHHLEEDLRRLRHMRRWFPCPRVYVRIRPNDDHATLPKASCP